MSGQKQWSAAWTAWLVALAAAGCSDRHLPSKPGSEDELEDGGGTEPPGDGDEAPPWIIDGVDARLTCPITMPVEEALSVSCPVVMSAGPCDEPDVPCVHYDTTSVTGSLLVCETRCRRDLGPPFWATNCSNECKRECPEPPAGAVIVELDASDCMSLPLEECFADGLTLQDQVDGELQTMLHPATSSADIVDQSVVVYFENGCATRVHWPNERLLPIIEPILRRELAGLRLSCASALSCGVLHGPMTLP